MKRAGWGLRRSTCNLTSNRPPPRPSPLRGGGIILRRTLPARDVLLPRRAAGNSSTLGLQTQSKFVGEDPGDDVLSYQSHGWARCGPWLRLRGAWRAEQARAAALRAGLQEVLQRVG